MPESLPEPGVGLTVRDVDGGEHRSQVYAAAWEILTLVCPTGMAAGVPLLVGAEMTLAWSHGDASVLKVRAQLRRMRFEGADRLWDVECLGAIWVEQRRQWDRLPATGAITLTDANEVLASVAARAVIGDLLDVSEVAARCLVDAHSVWASRRNAPLFLSFALGGEDLGLRGRVITSQLRRYEPSLREVVVGFDEPAMFARALSRHVAAEIAPMSRDRSA